MSVVEQPVVEPPCTPPAKTVCPVLWQVLAFVLCAAGFALSLHLLHRGLILKNDPFPPIDPCRKVFGWFAVDAGCDNTLGGPRSSMFGLPIAGWGVIYFAAVAALPILALVQKTAFRREAAAAGLLLTTCGAGGALYLASLMALGKVPVCPACLTVHALCLALVPLFKLAYGGTLREWGGQLLSGLKYLLGAKSDHPTESAWKAIGFVNVLLVAATAYVWVDAAGKAGTGQEQDSSTEAQEQKITARRLEVEKKYDETKAVPIPVDDDDPRIGPKDAPCQIVVFSTFHCRGCQGVAFALDNLRRDYPKEVSIVYKYQTYGEETCPRDQNEAEATVSCRANWAAEAAHRQGKFWEYHDALFARGVECTDEDLVAVAKSVGLDMEKFEADRRSPEVRERVAKHLLLGSSLGVVITPDALLNGKRFPEFGHQQFAWVVEHVLNQRENAETDLPGKSAADAPSGSAR